MVRRNRTIVLLGMMTRHPVAGVVWQTIQYVIGFTRLGYQTYYVEAGAHQPSSLLMPDGDDHDDRARAAANFIDGVMRRFDLGDRWAFQALHSDGRCYGLSESQLERLYETADWIINLHGATLPRPEHCASGRLVYLETDPVAPQIELYDNRRETIEFLSTHQAFFTFGENYGRPTCEVPVCDRFNFRPTRQPVVTDFWQAAAPGPGANFTTIGNWQQQWRDVTFKGEIYHWSKHYEFLKFIDLPIFTSQPFELALSRYVATDRQLLESKGWRVRDALSFSTDLDAYRAYILGSRGEFTVAKDQNVRLRSGWFSDRTATYLAAGRPTITQETGFTEILPTGEGLFAFSTREDILAAIETVNADYRRHSRAAIEVARGWFNYDVVLTRLLRDLGE